MELQELSALVAGYPDDAPQFGDQLVEADSQSLAPLARELRRHLVMALQAGRQISLACPMDVKRALELGHLFPLARKWSTYALDADRHRVMVPRTARGKGAETVTTVAQRSVTRRVPDPARLKTDNPLPAGGVYVVLYGGGPDILAVRDHHGGGVAEDIAKLRAEAPVADVLFRHLEKGEPPALYSLAAGKGDKAGGAVEFPDRHFLDVALGGPSTRRKT